MRQVQAQKNDSAEALQHKVKALQNELRNLQGGFKKLETENELLRNSSAKVGKLTSDLDRQEKQMTQEVDKLKQELATFKSVKAYCSTPPQVHRSCIFPARALVWRTAPSVWMPSLSAVPCLTETFCLACMWPCLLYMRSLAFVQLNITPDVLVKAFRDTGVRADQLLHLLDLLASRPPPVIDEIEHIFEFLNTEQVCA
jgi:hypothetical protein